MTEKVIADIQQESEQELSAALASAGSVILLDYPLYMNPGDTLIFAGQQKYLAKLGIEIAYMSDIRRFDQSMINRLSSEVPILFSGGGNFGDRWPIFQNFRESIIARNSERRVIQLPQSIDFSTDESATRAARCYSSHGGVSLLLRDFLGLSRAREIFGNSVSTAFCHDMAFGNGAIESPSQSTVDVVELKRRDIESVSSSSLYAANTTHSSLERDWGLGTAERLRWNFVKAPSASLARLRVTGPSAYRLTRSAYESLTTIALKSAVRLIANGDIVVTDRLHAAVLGLLLGKNVIARDNANKKLSAIGESTLAAFEAFSIASSKVEAGSKVDEILQRR